MHLGRTIIVLDVVLQARIQTSDQHHGPVQPGLHGFPVFPGILGALLQVDLDRYPEPLAVFSNMPNALLASLASSPLQGMSGIRDRAWRWSPVDRGRGEGGAVAPCAQNKR